MKPPKRLRKIYWVHPGHLSEGRMISLERKPIYRGMVRVRVEPAPRRRKTLNHG